MQPTDAGVARVIHAEPNVTAEPAPSTPAPLSLRLLGGVAADLNGARVEVTGKSLALLCILALDGEVERAVLADLLWSDCGEERARRNLRRELHRLHATPAGPYVQARGSRLALRGDVQVDAARVARLLAEGQDAGALAGAGGPLLAGLHSRDNPVFDDWLDARAARFEAGLAEARRRHAEALERGGQLREALAVHAAAVAADALREHHHAALIRLHLALGERAEALARYAALERLLREELAIEPLPETRALAEAARHAPALPAPTPGAALDLGRGLVGRAAELAGLARHGASLIVGEPGVGKSRLAAEFARLNGWQSGRAGGPPLTLQAREDAARLPFAPIAQALAAPELGARLAGLPAPLAAAAARLTPGQPPPDTAGPEHRFALIAGLAEALMKLAGPAGTLLVEDLHWLDAASADVLAQVLRARPAGLRVVLTARAFELGARTDLAGLLAGLLQAGQLARLPLGALSAPDLLELVRGATGQEAPLFARWLHGATGGNPLFVFETLRELHARGDLTVGAGGWSTPYDDLTVDYSELPVPPGVREVIVSRAALLGGPARRLLDAASLCAAEVRADQLASVCALDHWETVEGLERAEEARLLTVAPGGHYQFAHDLYRQSLAQSVRPERRRLIHAELARVLARDGADPGRVAHHYQAAGQPAAARPHWQAAAEQAARLFEYGEALALYGRALEGDPPPRAAYALRAARLEAARALGDDPARLAELAHLEQLARALDDPELLAGVAVKRACRHVETDGYLQAHAEMRRALDAHGDRLSASTRAALLLEDGAALVSLDRFAEAGAALAEAERLSGNDVAQRANVRYWLGQAALLSGDAGAAATMLRAALADCQATRHARGAALTRWRLGEALAVQGEREAGLQALRAALDGARRQRLAGVARLIAADLALWLVRPLAGQPTPGQPTPDQTAEAWALLDTGEAGADPDDDAARSAWARVRGWLLHARGGPADPAASLAAFARADVLSVPGSDEWTLTRRDHLAALLRAGQLAEARELLAQTEAGPAPPHGYGAWRAWLRAARAYVDGDPAGAARELDAALAAGTGPSEDLLACRALRALIETGPPKTGPAAQR